MKFTKEEISLCKQIAEKHRIKIEYGDWYWSSAYPKILLAMDYGFKPTEQEFAGVFKIWTISDCLEFLREKGWLVRDLIEYEGEFGTTFLHQVMSGEKFVNGDGKTPLEACLRVVLDVLEEEE